MISSFEGLILVEQKQTRDRKEGSRSRLEAVHTVQVVEAVHTVQVVEAVHTVQVDILQASSLRIRLLRIIQNIHFEKRININYF